MLFRIGSLTWHTTSDLQPARARPEPRIAGTAASARSKPRTGGSSAGAAPAGRRRSGIPRDHARSRSSSSSRRLLGRWIRPPDRCRSRRREGQGARFAIVVCPGGARAGAVPRGRVQGCDPRAPGIQAHERQGRPEPRAGRLVPCHGGPERAVPLARRRCSQEHPTRSGPKPRSSPRRRSPISDVTRRPSRCFESSRAGGALPHHLRVWYVMADVLERSGRRSEAADRFRRIMEHDPDAFDVAERLSALS